MLDDLEPFQKPPRPVGLVAETARQHQDHRGEVDNEVDDFVALGGGRKVRDVGKLG
jgi:hypothetical protein